MASKYKGWMQTTFYLRPEEHDYLVLELHQRNTSINRYMRSLVLKDLGIEGKLHSDNQFIESLKERRLKKL